MLAHVLTCVLLHFLACLSIPATTSCAPNSDAFDSPQRSEDYRDVFRKGAHPRAPAPRRRRPQNKEAVLRRLCFAWQPDPTQPAEDLEKQGGDLADHVSQGRGRQSRTVYRCSHRYCGVAALGRAAQLTDVGGLTYLRARTFVRRAPSRTPTNRRKGLLQGFLWRVNLGETGGGDQNGMRRPIAT